MLLFVLLFALPAVVLCNSPHIQDQLCEPTIRYMEEHVKPCVLFERNCSGDNWSLSNYEQTVRQLISHTLPKECDCDTSQSSCVRPCYLAFIQKQLQTSIAAGQSNMTDIDVEQQMKVYRECLLEDKCDAIGGLNITQITQNIEAMKIYRLPKECKCDMTKESCIRICYYTFIRDSALASPPCSKNGSV